MSGEFGTPAQDHELHELGERLRGERPVPRAAFRVQLHQRLIQYATEAPLHARPRHLWRRAVALAASGTGLLALVGLGVAGSGPFAR
jgi:hypothetical protein